MKKTNLKRAKKITKALKEKRKTTSGIVRRRAKKFPVHYLAVILAVALILEGALFGITTGPDWRNAVQIMDVSSGVAEVQDNLSATFQPVTDLILDINQFYQLAAIQMARILDLSGNNPSWELEWVYNGVSEFYQQASVQMSYVLDISSATPWSGQVAGISIENYK